MFTVGPFLRRADPGRAQGGAAGASGPARGWSRLGGDARRGVAGRGARDPGGDRRAATPFPQRSLIIFTVFCVIVLGPARPGPHAAGADPGDRPRARRGRRRRRRGARPRRGGRGGARAPGRDGADAQGEEDRATDHLRELYEARLRSCARAPGRARRRRPRARRGLRARCARSSCAPSAQPCTSSTPAARYPRTRCARWSATSTSRRRGWTHAGRHCYPPPCRRVLSTSCPLSTRRSS